MKRITWQAVLVLVIFVGVGGFCSGRLFPRPVRSPEEFSGMRQLVREYVAEEVSRQCPAVDERAKP